MGPDLAAKEFSHIESQMDLRWKRLWKTHEHHYNTAQMQECLLINKVS